MQEHIERFARDRAYVLGRLDTMRLQIDVELELLLAEQGEVLATTIARMEGLLTARRDTLTQLADLDNTFIERLLASRQPGETAAGSS